MPSMDIRESGAVKVHGFFEPPRTLWIKLLNPIPESNFEEYRIRPKQAWEGRPGRGDVEIMEATNSDPLLGDGRYKRIGGLFYSLSGVYSYDYYEAQKNILPGPLVVIGDFDTLDAALHVLEGIGVISDKDLLKIQDAASGMENAR